MGSEGRLNGFVFRHVLQVPIPAEQKSSHVACENQLLDHSPQGPQWGLEHERVNHEGSRWLGDEGMVMPHRLEDAPDHLINKVMGALACRDPGGKVLLDAEMD